MNEYLAFTQASAGWLLTHSGELEAFIPALLEAIESPALTKAVFSAGPLRIASSADRGVVAIWHAEYLSPTGIDGWGYIRLKGKHGALLVRDRLASLIKTALRVFEARLQGLLLSDTILVRSHGDESFTCVLGGGQAKDATIAYVEATMDARRSVVVVGPEVATGGGLAHAHAMLLKTIKDSVRPQLRSLVTSAPAVVEQARARPSADDSRLLGLRRALLGEGAVPAEIIVAQPQLRGSFSRTELAYEEWVAPDSVLSDDKRRILEGDILDRQPLRISGPAGTGKTLLLQLMAVRASRKETGAGKPSILYVAHNSESQERAENALKSLSSEASQYIKVATLHQLCVERLGLPDTVILDNDANETRRFQTSMVATSLERELHSSDLSKSPLFAQAKAKPDIFEAIVFLIVHEISAVLKPLRLYEDPRRYADSERPFSRLHGLLSPAERRLVLAVFKDYHGEVFEKGGLLDADDLALSLLSRLRTPVWTLQRRTEGFDYVFVDEAQLYNENERRLFPVLTKPREHIPVAFALDEAQAFGSNLVAGFGALGITSLRDEALRGVFRTTEPILRLAFNIIQQTTDLFGPDFPDFTTLSASVVRDEGTFPAPSLYRAATSETLPDAVLRHVRDIKRTYNLRQVGVIVPSEKMYASVVPVLRAAEFQFSEIAQRGQKLDQDRPIVAACTPRLAGGQEFDAVIVVGVERGIVPPSVNVEGLALSLEQQVLRELYLSFTRAKHMVRVVNSANSSPANVLDNAIKANLLKVES